MAQIDFYCTQISYVDTVQSGRHIQRFRMILADVCVCVCVCVLSVVYFPPKLWYTASHYRTAICVFTTVRTTENELIQISVM